MDTQKAAELIDVLKDALETLNKIERNQRFQTKVALSGRALTVPASQAKETSEQMEALND
jgi:hypothetical protein